MASCLNQSHEMALQKSQAADIEYPVCEMYSVGTESHDIVRLCAQFVYCTHRGLNMSCLNISIVRGHHESENETGYQTLDA